MELPRVKIINERGACFRTKCYINDYEIKNVKSVNFYEDTKSVPSFKFETRGLPDLDMSGAIQFSFVPETIEQAVYILQNELRKHGEFYNGFLASIRSAIRDSENEIYENELAENILKRIIGEE